MIQLQNIAKEFEVGDQPIHALWETSESIHAGEYVAIMGPSGSGKSTLLNVIGCLLRPSSGSYRLDGREVGDLSDRDLSQLRQQFIGFVFQSFHLIPRLTAAGNVEIPMIFAGIPPAERRERVEGALKAVGLTDRAHHRPNQLSVGQRQRVVIARAIIMNPKLLLADEPTGNLDSQSGKQVMDLLESLNQQGLTLLVVTHDQNVACRAQRTLVLADGRIIKRLSKAELAQPFFFFSPLLNETNEK